MLRRWLLAGLMGGLLGLALIISAASRLGLISVTLTRLDTHWFWYVGRTAGICAYVALALSVLGGLLLSTGVADAWIARARSVELHRWLSTMQKRCELFSHRPTGSQGCAGSTGSSMSGSASTCWTVMADEPAAGQTVTCSWQGLPATRPGHASRHFRPRQVYFWLQRRARPLPARLPRVRGHGVLLGATILAGRSVN
jgi:hypothetical protein